MAFCAVCGLRRTQATRVDLPVGFHLFPTESLQRQAWEDFCQSNKDEPDLRGRRSICSDHFEEQCFAGGRRDAERKRYVLREGAVPTIREGTSLKKLQQRLKKKQQRSEKVSETESQIQLAPVEPLIKLEHECRICALEDDTLHDLTLGENAEHARRFSSLTSIEIDPMSPWLCGRCLGRLSDAYEFVQACKEAENRRKSLFVETLQVKQEEEPMAEFANDRAGQSMESDEKQEDEDESSEDDSNSESRSQAKGPKVYSCEACQATFEKSTDYYAHVKTHGKSRFPCKLCDRSFPRKCSLVEHMYSHKIEPSFFCEHCSASFKCRSSLQRHQKTAHLGVKRFSCAECGKCFAQKTHLFQHAVVHVEEATIPCDLCSKMFKTDYSLRVHVRADHKDNRSLAAFECEVCSKQFPTKQTLTAHRTNHREPNLLCTVCGKKYRTNVLLVAHMATHKPKSFSCELCPSRFKTIKSLKYHRLVHAGLKPFQCELCERTFRCVTHLKTHQSVHSGVTSWPKTTKRNEDDPMTA